ncbi:hypothetical protein BBO99_00003824 [Phytophthora kernoviae]|uniref:Uncharacterized protein n=2 Tax=Phytophthora kernoviae TaxID=325452 RepID=A0A3R7JVE6_9STRA|nr:hypothetical protein G195_004246 [Phytophthora kernoviae 00238/432]KAG2527585.1 hypothetical protein JM16_003356 [Phytophthora kernoviae]KAG2528864.1 hypothetical protein JM18_003096 [Phytophthora kernoviae]RLN02877.1 hypothetical protein BBI17_003856 [Phytophthora kernoviae]RLN81318.1 hypothetical protein BBO99_00003824 [Phytophthora kernoviae]
MSPADPTPDKSRVLEETDWKLQRKLKHQQRGAGRRLAEGRPEPRFKQHAHHQHRNDVMRLEKEAWLSTPTKSARRTIPEHRQVGAHLHVTPLSRSNPSAVSWPPPVGVLADEFDENVDRNLGLSMLSLASSAPSTATLSRREARPITLFESARIFNESGQLLSHDNFDELGSSPEMLEGTPKRKFKRRVGRRKHELKRSDMVDALNADEVVLELMCLLFPDVEVAKELNLLLLGGAETLVEMYLTPPWIAHEVLSMVKLDVLAQYDRFAVINAIFRTIPEKRPCILAATSSASLAIFQHQGLADTTPTATGKDLVTVKGLLAFLNAAMDTIERDARYNPEAFGADDEEISDNIGGLCNQIMRTIRLLVRSSPGGSGSADANRNQLEKYAECSDSTEATSYRSLGEILYRMAAFSPMHGEEFLRWMLLKWPQRNVQLQLFFVRFTAGLLSQFMQLGLMFPMDVVHRAFARIQACIQSTHFLVAQEACNMCSNLQLMSMYLSCNQPLREKIASALHENSTSHWNKRIREISDECFDMLLDLA